MKIKKLRIKPGDHILEIGFGPGYSMGYMLKNYRSIKIDGVEVSDTMKEQAKKALRI
ncbi:class I SAM-dependent methyltransferase [Bacillus sp. F19]|nr:class I SAM-dependent methyltransferase [Bacillus sp. F19]